MNITIPRVTRPIRLSDYGLEYGEQTIQMWVNPPREARLAWRDLGDRFDTVRQALEATEDPDEVADLAREIEELGLQMYAWYASMWGDDWTAEDVKELAEAAIDADPQLWAFLQERSLEVMVEYRRQKKANTPEPPPSP